MPTDVKECTCKNEYQDKKYGKGKRVCNSTATGQWRCTVCGNTIGTAKAEK